MTIQNSPPRVAAPARSVAGSVVRRALIGIVLLAVMVTGGALLMHAGVEADPAFPGPPDRAERRMALSDVKQWGYQLQNLDPRGAAAAPFDLLVVDPDNLNGWRNKTRAEGVDIMRRKPDGNRRLVLAYLSIGEAESYRDYWNSTWAAPALATAAIPSVGTATPATWTTGARFAARALAGTGIPKRLTAAAPAWLVEENPHWRGNFRVRFWEPDWQAVIFGSAQSVLDQIVAAGFDGVYLDRADVHATFRAERPAAETEMVDFITRLAAHARTQNPGFLIVMQNAEELLSHARLGEALDAVAKEDLLYGVNGPTLANAEADVTSSLHYLQRFQKSGRPVLAVEYIDDRQQVEAVRRRIRGFGFLPYFAPRDLGRLNAAD